MEKILTINGKALGETDAQNFKKILELIEEKGLDIDFLLNQELIDIDPAELQRYGRNREAYLSHTILFMMKYYPNTLPVFTSVCWSFAAAGGGNKALSKMITDFDRFYARRLRTEKIHATTLAEGKTDDQKKTEIEAITKSSDSVIVNTYGKVSEYLEARVLLMKAVEETYRRAKNSNNTVLSSADQGLLNSNPDVIRTIEEKLGEFAHDIAQAKGVSWDHSSKTLPITRSQGTGYAAQGIVVGQPLPIVVENNSRIDALTWEAFSIGNLRRVGWYVIVQGLISNLNTARMNYIQLDNQKLPMREIAAIWNDKFGCPNGYWVDAENQSFALLIGEPHLFHPKLKKLYAYAHDFGHADPKSFMLYTVYINFLIAIKTQMNIWLNTKARNTDGKPNTAYLSSYYSTLDYYVRSNIPAGMNEFDVDKALTMFKQGIIRDKRPAVKGEILAQMEEFITTLTKKDEKAKSDADKQAETVKMSVSRV